MVLNIISQLYDSENFVKFLIIAIIVLAAIFAIIFLFGFRDLRKSNEPDNNNDDDLKDFSFDIPADAEQIKEDVTFEMPSLTKNLEDFKKSIEEEIQKENNQVAIRTEIKEKNKEEKNKAVRILDIDEIEDTSILPKIKEEKKPVNKGKK